MTVVAYMLKDRMKVWGERYFRCIADWTGVFLPECNSWLCTSEGVKVSLLPGSKKLCHMRFHTSWLLHHSPE